jgi:excinuclease ABC subunit C
VRDGSLYFGPYTSVGMVRTILDVIKQLYAIRTCGYNLAQDNIAKGNYKVCLEYHLGNCKGPCEGLQEEGEYNEMIDQIKNILKGNLNSVTSHLQSVMDEYASLYEFEKAAEIKSKFDILEKYRSKSTIVGSSITDLDVFSFDEDEKFGYVNFLKVVDGAIIQSHTIEMRKRLDESKEELLALGIVEIRQKVFSNAREIVVPFFPDTGFGQINFTVPQRGDKRKLLELSQKNARFYKLEKRKQQSLRNPQNKVDRIMETMKIDLRLKEVPVHIECFDNSNIQGNYPVASCVVFRNGKPAKRDYRHFNIKTVEGPNDFASMEEIIFRRYRRLLDEEKDLPQLIVIDGGKGQLGAALNALEKLGLRGKISIIGIAKRLEEIFFPGDSIPIYLDKNSETLKIIQRLRDEAHRFGITFHRNKRSAGFIKSELDSIPGIGPKTVEALLKEFKSLEQIKSRSIEKIAGIIGRSKAEKIISFFNSNSSKSTNK